MSRVTVDASVIIKRLLPGRDDEADDSSVSLNLIVPVLVATGTITTEIK